MVNVKESEGAIIFGRFVKHLQLHTKHVQWEYIACNILRTNYDQRTGQCRNGMRIV
jgi:nitrite reductase/ring-hydroxylating ferredoxin subunit